MTGVNNKEQLHLAHKRSLEGVTQS